MQVFYIRDADNYLIRVERYFTSAPRTLKRLPLYKYHTNNDFKVYLIINYYFSIIFQISFSCESISSSSPFPATILAEYELFSNVNVSGSKSNIALKSYSSLRSSDWNWTFEVLLLLSNKHLKTYKSRWHFHWNTIYFSYSTDSSAPEKQQGFKWYSILAISLSVLHSNCTE